MLRNPSARPRKRKKNRTACGVSERRQHPQVSLALGWKAKPCYPCFDPRFPGLLARLLGVWLLWGVCLDSGATLQVSAGFSSHSRTECSTGAPSPGKQGNRLAGEQPALPQTRGWHWAHQNRPTLEKDFSNDEGWFPDNGESFPLEMSQTVPTRRQHGALMR